MKIYSRLLILLLSLSLGICSVAFAAKKDKVKKAPDFPRKGIWLNEELHYKTAYQDKLTLVYFWDYTSINCVREIGTLKLWYEQYHPYGLEMIWVHAPEFEFAKDFENVHAALMRFEIHHPVFLDNDFEVWEGFRNQSWPAKYLVNGQRHIVHSQVGEGRYAEMEEYIRWNLREMNPGVVLPEQAIAKDIDKFDTQRCGLMSTETYVGYKRASWWGGQVANKRWMSPDETMMFKDRGERVERGFFVEGLWTNREDNFVYAGDSYEFKDYLGLIYVAHEVYVVASRVEQDEKPRIYVTRDDVPVPPKLRGLDLRGDEDDKTYFTLDESRLYYLIQSENQEPHELKVWTNTKGVAINSFSFANICLSEFEHV